MIHITRNTFIYLSTISILLLNSCSKLTPEFPDESCIPPVANLAYPVGIPPSSNAEFSEVDPLGGWKLQASLPEPSGSVSAPQIAVKPNDVWVLPLDGTTVFRYRTDTREWKSYDKIDSFSVAPRNLFLASDGTLWGVGTNTSDFGSQKNFSFLSRYEEEIDSFQFVRDNDGLLDNVLVKSSPANISEDAAGLLWFFGSLPGGDDVGLYSFVPSTRKAEKHLSLPKGLVYAGPVVTKDGAIWFYRGGAERQLIIYSPTSNQVQAYGGLLNFDELGHIWILFVDRDGRLWLDNKGWLDFKDPAHPVWYEIIRSSVFLTDSGQFAINWGDGLLSRYGWELPSRISQSSNGWYWFTTGRGTIRLEPERGEWCLFTTGSSPVVEDEKGNLWIVVFGKLYKYPLDL